MSLFVTIFLIKYPNLSDESKKPLVFTLATILTYFSAFRLGLGQDYEGYKRVIFENSREYSFVEPVYTFLVKFINEINSTEVLFFLVFAFVTNFSIVYSYSRFKNFHIMIIVYVSFSILYFNTFNVVRQYCAASIVLLGLIYIERRDFYKYFLVVATASLFHLSALLCSFFYFLWKVKIPGWIMIVIAIASFCYGFVGGEGLGLIIKDVALFFNIYGLYFHDAPEGQGSGLLTVYFNFVLCLIVFMRNTIVSKPIDEFILLMFFLLTVIYNLIPNFFYLYRVSIYFLLFFPLILSISVSNERLFKALILMSSLVIFLYFITTNMSNPGVVPAGIKTFSDLIG
jgi:transmembrane protein EpsG